MKTSVIIRMICWALIALFLVAMLVWSLAGDGPHLGFPSFFGRSGKGGFGELKGEAGKYSSSNTYSVDSQGIKRIKISWVDGGVMVKAGEGNSISFQETARSDIPESNALRYAVQGDTLTIHYSQNRVFNPTWWSGAKSLEVLIPAALASNLEELNVDAVSAGVAIESINSRKISVEAVSGRQEIQGCEAEKLGLNTTSGSIDIQNCTIGDIQADSVSGSIRLQGAFDQVETDSVSGSVSVTSSLCPAEVRMDTVSGALALRIPDNQGFTAKYNTVSGGFHCDFAASISKSSVTYGDGASSFHFDSVSGGIRIEQLRQK